MRRFYFILAGVSLLFSSLGRAAPIEYAQDRRSLTYQRYLGFPVNDYQSGVDVPLVPFQNWYAARGDGSAVNSNLYPDQMYGSLEGSIYTEHLGYPPGTLEYSHPIHNVSFDLTETQIVSLHLAFAGGGDRDWFNVEAALLRDGEVILGSSSIDVIGLQLDQQFPVPELFYTATLDPGRYRLRVALQPFHTLEAPEPGFHYSSRWTYFNFQVAPEPGTSALLAWGLVGLAVACRFQRLAVRLSRTANPFPPPSLYIVMRIGT